MRGRRGRDQFEAFGFADGDVVQNDGREIGEQGVEAVHGRRVRRAFARGLGPGRGGGPGGFDRRGALRPGGLRIVLVEQDRGQAFSHVPFGVVGEHAQEDVGTDAGFAVDEDRPDSEPSGLDLPEGLLDLRQAFVCLHRLVRSDAAGVEAGADDPKSVERGFAVDPVLAAAP